MNINQPTKLREIGEQFDVGGRDGTIMRYEVIAHESIQVQGPIDRIIMAEVVRCVAIFHPDEKEKTET